MEKSKSNVYKGAKKPIVNTDKHAIDISPTGYGYVPTKKRKRE